jgi:predicted transposase YbfD/YdcC
MTREHNRGRREIRVLECQEVTPEQVGFPGARLIARLRRRVRRRRQKSTETAYLISSLTLDQLNALGWLKLKRGYWIIESRLHHALDVSLDEDRSRVRNANAALILGMFRRLVVSIAQAAIGQVQTRKTRWSVRRYQQQFAHQAVGRERLRGLVFAKSPRAWKLQK